ncbi:MAG: hypothetical protein IIA45_03855, partial [Bacteroidetes bacterium]|nr:hypothetical protein [Bacteroidota bacterium]
MPVAELSESLKKRVLASQKSEITEHIIYKRLARRAKDPHNKEILNKISVDELAHFNFWKEYTNEDVKPDMFKIRKYLFISWLLGLTFGIKLMEREEGEMQISYEEIVDSIPEAKHILEEEHLHERQLIELLKEKGLWDTYSMLCSARLNSHILKGQITDQDICNRVEKV